MNEFRFYESIDSINANRSVSELELLPKALTALAVFALDVRRTRI